MSTKSASNLFDGTSKQLLTALSCTLPMISDGMQYGWSAPVIPLLRRDDSHIKITKREEELLETVYIVGAICGIITTIYLVDKLGRKKALILAAFTTLLVWIVIATSTKIEYILAARFFTGLAADMAFVAAPMYLAEIADQKIRGFLSSMIYLMMLFGILVIYAIAPYTPFYAPSVLAVILNSLGIISFYFMPESPYYLVIKNKPEKAKLSLSYFRKNQDITKEFEEIAEGVERDRREKSRPHDIVTVKSNRKALIIVLVLNAAQHMGCISVIIMNLHLILSSAGSIYIDSSHASIIFAAFMLVAATIASFYMDRYGRRILLLISTILTGLCLLSIAVYFYLKNTGVDVRTISWIPIVSVMVYAGAFKLGMGLVPIVLTSELFPSSVKAIGVTLSDVSYVVFALLSLEIYQYLFDNFGLHVPFFLFAASCFVTALYIFFCLPETKGKTLDEIQFMLRGEEYPSKTQDRKDIKYSSVENVA